MAGVLTNSIDGVIFIKRCNNFVINYENLLDVYGMDKEVLKCSGG